LREESKTNNENSVCDSCAPSLSLPRDQCQEKGMEPYLESEQNDRPRPYFLPICHTETDDLGNSRVIGCQYQLPGKYPWSQVLADGNKIPTSVNPSGSSSSFWTVKTASLLEEPVTTTMCHGHRCSRSGMQILLDWAVQDYGVITP
jgi:hypothetical protein